jgi:nitrogen fixation/metabolism regulation signal transduction histidine kinase
VGVGDTILHSPSTIHKTVKRFRVQLILRVAALAATAAGLAWLVLATRLYEAWLVVAGLLAWQGVALVRQATGAVRDLTRLLEAVRASDFSQTLPTEGRGPLIEDFGAAFDEVAEEFRRLRAEKQEQVRYLENIVRHVGVALIAFRSGGRVELINRAARRLLGVHPVRHIDALEEETSRPLVEALRRLSSGERALVDVPEPGPGGAEDGRAMQLSVYATRFRLRGEEHVLASMQDIRNELEEKEMEAWQELTRVLTHEIMNSVAPIASLAGTASRLLEDGAGPGASEKAEEAERAQDTREALSVIERRSEALMGFVESYRSFTRIPQPHFEMIEVEKILRGVKRLAEAQAGEQPALAVEIDVHPPGLTLTADPDLVEQVLINLALNSVQALEEPPSAESHAEPRVVLRARPGRNGVPYLQVLDNGPGIAPEARERIFVPFFTTKDDSSGIGLSLSRQIMRLHGGSLSVRSQPSDGDDGLQVDGFPDAATVFTLRF